MSLPTLRGILRGHYAEKNSTELYLELASAAQDAKETSSEFLMRSMDLRNKILFASQERSDELKYSPDLVHKLFARTVQTGLRDIVIWQEMKQFLSEDKSDAELLDELNKIVRRENENKQKVGKGSVSMVTRTSTSSQGQQLKLSRDNNNNDQRPVTRGCPDCRSKHLRNCRHCWQYGKSDHVRRNCPDRNRGSGSSSENGQGSRPRD